MFKSLVIYSTLSLSMLYAVPQGEYVGQLQEKWIIPSDHVPIGADYGDTKVLSWNVLNVAHMSWVIEKDSQGLKRSILGTENVLAGGKAVTVRDLHVIDKIQGMAFDILALQEAGNPFIEELEKSLSEKYLVVHTGNENALVYDKTLFSLVSSEAVKGLFSSNHELQNVVLENKLTGRLTRIINAHLPGNPNNPPYNIFAEYVTCGFIEDVIALGDMNFREDEMGDALIKADTELEYTHLYPSYCTNISPFVLYSKTIDHFYIKSELPVRIHDISEFDEDFQVTAKLLGGVDG